MKNTTSSVASPANCSSTALVWKVTAAVILGPFCILIGFIGEAVGAVAGFGAVAVCFLLVQYFLSIGLSLRQSRPILLGINFLPLCLGTFVIFVEQKSGAWTQGVLFIVLSITCSLAGAALAAHFSRRRIQQ